MKRHGGNDESDPASPRSHLWRRIWHARRTPRLLDLLLRASLGGGLRAASIRGDLYEEQARRARESRLRAALWLWRAALGVAARAASSAIRASLRGVLGDARFGLRMLRREPLPGFAAVLALGLGIGLTTIAFAVIDGSVRRGLPFPDQHELVHFERANLPADRDSMAVTPFDYAAWRRRQRSFVDLAAYVEALVLLGDADGLAEQHWGVAINANAFDLLGVEPMLGRTFTPEEDAPGGPEVMLIGHATWRGRYGADPGIVGRTVVVNGLETRILGVMPPEFGFPVADQFWRPLRLDPASFTRDAGRLDVFGRLLPDVSIEQARADFDAIAASLADEFPDTHTDITASLRTFVDEYVGEEFAARLWAMLAAATLVLLLAAVNVASLGLARAAGRGREVALRAALGAGRGRLARQLLIESAEVAALGTVVGIGIAVGGLRLFDTHWAGTSVFELPHGPQAPFWWSYGVDGEALGVAITLGAVAALASGLAPAIQLVRGGLLGVLHDGGRGGASRAAGRTLGAVLVAEVALCTALLLATGWVVRSIANLGVVGEGMEAEGLFVASAQLPSATVFSGAPDRAPTAGVYPDADARLDLWLRLEERMRALPDIAAAAVATTAPPSGAARVVVELPDRSPDADRPGARIVAVGPGFLDALGAPVLEGRAFDAGDGPGGAPVAVVNRSFAARHFPDGALQRRLRLGGEDSAEPWLTVVGVVPDLWLDGVRDRPGDREGLYVPLAQTAGRDARLRTGRLQLQTVDLVVRARGDGAAALGAVRRALAELDAGAPMFAMRSMRARLDGATERFRLHGSFYLVLGAVALGLATVGLYAVMSHAVRQRVPEIGTRMALGAGSARILREVIALGLRRVIPGMAVGLLVASWLQPQVQRVLYQVSPWEPSTTVAVLALLLAVSVAACLLPARRATRVSPREAIGG